MSENNSNDQKQGGLSWTTPAQSPMPVQKPVITPNVQMMPPKQASNSTKYISMIVLGVIAGVIIAWGYSALRSPQEASTADTNTGSDTSTALISASGLGLTIASPQIAGNSVAVAKAVVFAPTWIVVYENNGGQPGNALLGGALLPRKSGRHG